MKRYNLFFGVVLFAIMELMSVKCKAQSYIPLDWETTRGVSVSYDFSQEYLLSISCFGTPYWGEGRYYHSLGLGIPRRYKRVLYNASVPDTLITKMTIINGDTTQFEYKQINRDTTITKYSYGYFYYEPGINLNRYLTITCKVGFSYTCNETVFSGTPAYNSEITVIDIPSGSSYHNSSSNSATSSQKWKKEDWRVLLAPSIIGHIPISEDLRLTTVVGYNFFLPILESTTKYNGLNVGVGLEFVLD